MSKKICSKKYKGVYISKLVDGDVAYYITYKDHLDKKVWKKIGLKSEGICAIDCRKKRNEIIFQLDNGYHIDNLKEIYTLNEAFEDYLVYAKSEVKTWKYNVDVSYTKHIQKKFGHRKLTSLRTLEFENLKYEYKLKGYANASIKDIIGNVRTIINYAIKHEKVKGFENPLQKGRFKMPKLDNKRIGFFTESQMSQLIDILSKRRTLLIHDLTVLLYHTGARFSEVASLVWNDINFSEKLIFFKSTKNGNERYIAITEPVMEVLVRLAENKSVENNLLISSTRTGKQIQGMPKQWQHIVNDLIAGNENKECKYKLVPHSLRHTHASHLAIAGVDIRHIQEQLGHRTLEMTQRYSHLIPAKRHALTLEIFNKKVNNDRITK